MEVRLELAEINHELHAAEFALAVCRDLDALPLDGPDDEFDDDEF